jgi:hypothetical protein
MRVNPRHRLLLEPEKIPAEDLRREKERIRPWTEDHPKQERCRPLGPVPSPQSYQSACDRLGVSGAHPGLRLANLTVEIRLVSERTPWTRPNPSRPRQLGEKWDCAVPDRAST